MGIVHLMNLDLRCVIISMSFSPWLEIKIQIFYKENSSILFVNSNQFGLWYYYTWTHSTHTMTPTVSFWFHHWVPLQYILAGNSSLCFLQLCLRSNWENSTEISLCPSEQLNDGEQSRRSEVGCAFLCQKVI